MSTNATNPFDGNYLERYRKGLLTPAEAHALEKAALEDPLLADALDGYMQAPRDTEAERTFLKSWINERVEENQAAIRYIPRSNNFQSFLRVAAVFLVLIGAAWLGYVLWLEPKSPQLADRGVDQNTTVQTAPPTPSSTLTDDSLIPARPVTPTPSPLQKTDEPPVAMLDPTPPKETNTMDLQEAAPIVQVPPVRNADTEKIAPEPVRTEETESRNAQVTESRSVRANTKKQLVQDEPTPLNGWASYEEYLNQSRQMVPSPDNRNVSAAQVLLSFQVGEDGRPRDVRVERSAGSQYDKKAIDLLLKGPDWKASRTAQRGLVQIRF